MSRYLILLILNLPFILSAIFSTIISYKMRRVSRRRALVQVVSWLAILVALASAETIYEWLFSHRLTETEPLSLFDVIQITAIVAIFYTISRFRSRIDLLEDRLRKLNTEVSIELSDK